MQGVGLYITHLTDQEVEELTQLRSDKLRRQCESLGAKPDQIEIVLTQCTHDGETMLVIEAHVTPTNAPSKP